jgi:hypothetical protein
MRVVLFSATQPWLRPAAAAARCSECRAGVPGLPTWLSARFPEAESLDIDPGVPIDVLAFDLNSVVHTSLRKARDEDHAITLILKQLHAIQRSAPPARFVLLALDGAAPLAKVRTQRRRRQKSHAREARRAGEGRRSSRGLSPLLATPGTAFMSSVESALLYWSSSEALRSRIPRSPPGVRALAPCRYLVSGADTPGEGELKILSWLMCHSRSTSPADRVRSAVVVSRPCSQFFFSFPLSSPTISIHTHPHASTQATAPSLITQVDASALRRPSIAFTPQSW